MNENFLEKIECFANLPELIGLDLSSNLIEVINVNAFTKLENLLWLNIAHNCLLNVALHLPIRALHSLNIAHNLINEFPQLSGSISAITQLDLSHNKIVDLKIEFTSMKALSKSIHSLNINDNQLEHPNQLLTFVNLVELNLAGNENIDYASNEKFVRHLASLKKLNLEKTNLTSFDIFRYVDGAQFTELCLTNNPYETNFNELLKFPNLIHLEFEQKMCYIFDDYRAIRRNFRNLKSVKILYTTNTNFTNCKCIRWNKMQFEFVGIVFMTDWSFCDNDPDCGQSMKHHSLMMIMTVFVVISAIKLF